MAFKDFKTAVQRRFNDIKGGPIFQARIDKDFLWALYLDSFLEGTNPIYRERSEHDCSACRSFIKHAGGMVRIVDGQLESLWDIQVGGEFQPSLDAMAEYVKACAIENVFLYTDGNAIGTDKNFEETTDRGVLTWEHLHVSLPKELTCKKEERGPKEGEYRAQHDVVLRSLREITPEAIETVLDLIAQNSLYRGTEKKSLVETFSAMKAEFDKIHPGPEQDYYAWLQVAGPRAWACKIRNDVIGTLLVDLSEGVDLEKAVKTFEDKVSGGNYQRPKSLITSAMKDKARKTLEEMGLLPSLERRYATLDDIAITDLLFADRSVKQKLGGDVWDELPTKRTAPKLDRVEEITIDKFVSDVLPTAKSLEVMVENRHVGNLVSLIAPVDVTAPTLFKWDNAFSWSYNGDVADSEIRRKVQSAGGRVDGVFRFSHSWNYRKRNASLMDLHVFMPGSTIKPGNMVNDIYGNGERVGWNNRNHAKSKGTQDVDYVQEAPPNYVPVENITFPDIAKMPEGTYICKVHNWKLRSPTDGGFKAEIECGGELFEYEVDRPLGHKEWVEVAHVVLKDGQFTVEHKLPTSTSSRDAWSLKTNEFVPVSAVMLSPNHWGEQGVGNKHYLFMLQGCKNDGTARGFYNEFLKSELSGHRKTMEIVGSRMRTEESNDQLSGLGFSATQRNSVVVKVKGSFERLLKVTF